MAAWYDNEHLMQFGETPYEALGVPQHASQAEITAAFKEAAKRLHPDKNTAANAHDHMVAVNAAHDILGDSVQRQQYDTARAAYEAAKMAEGEDAEYEEGEQDTEEEERQENDSGAGLPQGLNSESPSFRIRTARLLVTYPGLSPVDLTHDAVLSAINAGICTMTRKGKLVTIVQYALGREVHKNPSRATHNIHYHIAVQFSARLDTTNPRIFDVAAADGQNLHPNIRPVATELHWGNALRYALKEGHKDNKLCLTGSSIEHLRLACSEPKTKKRKWGDVVKEAAEQTSSVDAAMAALWEEDPAIYLVHAATIRSNLAGVMPHPVTRPAELDSFLPPFDEHFNFRMDTEGDVSEWPRSIILAGRGGTGKTYRALAEYERPLLISHSNLEQLEHVVASGPYATTHIVFDEFDFRQAGKGGVAMSPEEALSLLNWELPTSIAVRYKTLLIPAIPRIFTTNLSMDLDSNIFPAGRNNDQAGALSRRYRIIRVTQPMWRNDNAHD